MLSSQGGFAGFHIVVGRQLTEEERRGIEQSDKPSVWAVVCEEVRIHSNDKVGGFVQNWTRDAANRVKPVVEQINQRGWPFVTEQPFVIGDNLEEDFLRTQEFCVEAFNLQKRIMGLACYCQSKEG